MQLNVVIPILSTIVLDDGINPPTTINNPVGAYDFTGEAWVSIVATDCINVTELIMGSNPDLGTLTITGSPTLPKLTVSGTSIVTLDLSEQTEVSELNISSNSSLTTLNLSALDHVDTGIGITINPLLTALNLSAFLYVNGDIDFQNNSGLVTLDLLSLNSFAQNLYLTDCSSLVTLNLSGLDASGSGAVGCQLDTGACVSLVTVTLPAVWPFVDNFTVNLSDNALSQASVDGVINSAYASFPAITASTIDVSGDSSISNSPPSGTAETKALAMITAGNTVLYNATALEFWTKGGDALVMQTTSETLGYRV